MRIQSYQLQSIINFCLEKQRNIILKVDKARFEEKDILRKEYKSYLYGIKICKLYLKTNKTIKKKELYEIFKSQLLPSSSHTKKGLYEIMRLINDF